MVKITFHGCWHVKKSIKLNLIIFSFTNSLRWDVPIGVTQTSEKSFFSRSKYSAKITYNKIFMKMRFPVGTLRWSLSKCLLKTIHTICVCTNIVWRKQKEHRLQHYYFHSPKIFALNFESVLSCSTVRDIPVPVLGELINLWASYETLYSKWA